MAKRGRDFRDADFSVRACHEISPKASIAFGQDLFIMGDILSVYTRLVLRYARGAYVARYETAVSVVASDAAPPSADAPLPNGQ